MRLRPLCIVASLGFGLAALGHVGCGSGIGGSGDTLGQGIGIAQADWLIVDLAQGSIDPRMQVADLTTNAAYRTTHVVFRRIPAGTAQLGSASSARWAQSDETQRTTPANEIFLAAFELTRAQWVALAGTTPWADVTPTGLVGAAGQDQLPAAGLSLTATDAAIAASRFAGKMRLPTSAEWEYAARAGAATSFAWGEARDDATVARYAVVRQTATSVGPRIPGGREANAFGFADMAGNLWEWTSDGELRGGSWRDGLAMARSANRLAIDTATPHALAGVRLVYRP